MKRVFKLSAAIAFLTICFASEGAAQVYVAPPIRVPPVTDFSRILISREIGRTAVKGMQRRKVRRRRSVNASKSRTTRRKVSAIDTPLQERQEQFVRRC